MKTKKYHTVRTISKSNRKIVEMDPKSIPQTNIHDRSLSWFAQALQQKVGVKL